MSNTITDYFTFSPGTKARSSQVNTNFSNYRGDIIPVNTDTATASDLSHDLGQADHRWAELYVDTVLFADQTTAGLGIRGGSGGQSVEIFTSNTTKAVFDNSVGLQRQFLGHRQDTSGGAATSYPQQIINFIERAPAGSTTGTSTIGTLEINPTGRVVMIDLRIMNAASPGALGIQIEGTSTSDSLQVTVDLLRGASTIASSVISHFTDAGGEPAPDHIDTVFPSFIDVSAAAGSVNTYTCLVTGVASSSRFSYHIGMLVYEP